MPAATAPALAVDASSEGSVVRLHLDTENFVWAKDPKVTNIVEGEGIGRLYVDDLRIARIFSPDVILDTRAWHLKPGEHVATVILTGSDLVSYAADGREVEANVPFNVSDMAPVSEPPVVVAPAGSSFTVFCTRDPFGGWTFTSQLSGFDGSAEVLEFAVNGLPWARTPGGSIHIYPEAMLGLDWEEASSPPVVTVTAIDGAGNPVSDAAGLAQLSFEAPVSTEPVVREWSASGGMLRLFWLVGVLVAIALVVALVLVVRRRR